MADEKVTGHPLYREGETAVQLILAPIADTDLRETVAVSLNIYLHGVMSAMGVVPDMAPDQAIADVYRYLHGGLDKAGQIGRILDKQGS